MKYILGLRDKIFRKFSSLKMLDKSFHFQVAIIAIFQVILSPIFMQNLKSLEKIHQQLISFYDIAYYSEALYLLKQIKTQFPELYILNNYAYLEGRINQQQGNFEQVITSFKSLIKNSSSLSDYAEFRLAEIYEKLDAKDNQQKHLEELISSYPNSALLCQAYLQLAELCCRTYEYQKAIALYDRLSAESIGEEKYKAIFSAGKLYQKNNMPYKALEKFYKLLQISDSSDFSLDAANEIERIERKLPDQKLSDKKIWLRLKVYSRNREFRKATNYGKKLVKEFPQSRWIDEAYYHLGLAYMRRDSIENAKIWFWRLTEKYPKSPLRPSALFRLGNIRLLEGDETSAISNFSSLINQHPHSRWAEAALVKLLNCYHQIGETEKGLAFIDSMVKHYPNSVFMADALMQSSKICWENEKIDSAFNYLEFLLNGNFSINKKAEALYWKAKLHQKLGQKEQAMEHYRGLISSLPNSYYSFLARQQIIDQPYLGKLIKASAILADGEKSLQLGDLNKAKNLLVQTFYLTTNDDIKQRSEIMLAECYFQMAEYKVINLLKAYETRNLIAEKPSNPEELHYYAAKELLFLHLYDEAVAELIDKLDKKNADLNDLYSIALFCQKAKLFSKSIRFAEQIASKLPDDYCLAALNENIKTLLYPIYYYEEINKYAQLRDLDELFLAAVIREESRFDHLAKSSASARGLMQFIPSTARHISRTLGERDFNLEKLYNPEFSIKIGSKYIQQLLKEFKGDYLAALAAYNAGEQNAHRWLKICQNKDPEQLLLEISFRETKDYVKRVMSSYWEYRLLFYSTSNGYKNASISFPIADPFFSQ